MGLGRFFQELFSGNLGRRVEEKISPPRAFPTAEALADAEMAAERAAVNRVEQATVALPSSNPETFDSSVDANESHDPVPVVTGVPYGTGSLISKLVLGGKVSPEGVRKTVDELIVKHNKKR